MTQKKSSIGRVAHSFVYFWSYMFKSEPANLLDTSPLSLLRLLKALCSLGVSFNPRVDLCTKNNEVANDIKSEALLLVLFRMFNIGECFESAMIVGQCIRFGWIDAASDEPEDANVLKLLIDLVHNDMLSTRSSFLVKAHFRIIRQLLALGLSRAGLSNLFEHCHCCARLFHSNTTACIYA